MIQCELTAQVKYKYSVWVHFQSSPFGSYPRSSESPSLKISAHRPVGRDIKWVTLVLLPLKIKVWETAHPCSWANQEPDFGLESSLLQGPKWPGTWQNHPQALQETPHVQVEGTLVSQDSGFPKWKLLKLLTPFESISSSHLAAFQLDWLEGKNAEFSTATSTLEMGYAQARARLLGM